jgi:hypothetical protein
MNEDEDFEEDFLNCYINNKHSDLGQHYWDWMYNNFATELYGEVTKTLDEHYDVMIKSSQNYYIYMGMAKSCKCMSCRDGVGLVVLDRTGNSKIYLVEWIRSNERLSSHYIEEVNKFINHKLRFDLTTIV